MSFFPVNEDLFFGVFVLVNTQNAFLQLEHNGAGGVNQVDVVFFRDTVCLWRLSMSTDEDSGVMKGRVLIVVNDLQPHVSEPLHFLVVVYNVTQTIEGFVLQKVFFCRSDSVDHAEAETGVLVNNNFFWHGYQLSGNRESTNSTRLKICS